MKTNCTKCNKEWVVSKYINPEDYECHIVTVREKRRFERGKACLG